MHTLPAVAMGWIASVSSLAEEEPALRFADRYADAFEEARLRNVPVLILDFDAWQDGEDRILGDFFRDRSFVDAAQQAVLLLASQEEHGEKTEVVEGAERKVCKKYGAVPCRTHQLILHEVFQEFAVDGELRSPQFLVLTPERAPLARLYEEVNVSEVRRELVQAQKTLGRGMSQTDYREIRDLLARSRRSRELGNFRQAVRFTARAGKLAESTRMGAEAEAERAALSEQAEGLRAEAGDLWNAGRHLESLLAYDRVAYYFSDFPVGKESERELKKLLSSEEGQGHEDRVESEHKARALFDDAEELAEQDKNSRALSVFRSLVKRYPDTLWAEKAEQQIRILSGSP